MANNSKNMRAEKGFLYVDSFRFKDIAYGNEEESGKMKTGNILNKKNLFRSLLIYYVNKRCFESDT